MVFLIKHKKTKIPNKTSDSEEVCQYHSETCIHFLHCEKKHPKHFKMLGILLTAPGDGQNSPRSDMDLDFHQKIRLQ